MGKPKDTILYYCENLKIEVSKEESASIEKVTRAQSGSSEWFEHRRGRITGSIAKQVATTNLLRPSDTLIKKICYPELERFAGNEVTRYAYILVDIEKLQAVTF